MAIANYADLQAAIPNWLSRADLAAGGVNVARVPEIIALAEARINTDLRLSTMGVVDTATTMTANNVATAWDVATRVIRSIKLTGFTPPRAMSFVSPESLVEVQLSSAGIPAWYTIRAAGIEWNQPPASAYALAIEYFPRLNIASSSTNWLLTALPNLYLYACLVVATMRGKDNEAAAGWKAAYDEDLARGRRLVLAMSGELGDTGALFDTPVFDEGSYNVLTDD
ncbi:MAG: hypothetical protein IT493_11980 [Gammaproteobacteria bacterium]|nr:hypothetical protein [Gammaproteobacteria bacterium]